MPNAPVISNDSQWKSRDRLVDPGGGGGFFTVACTARHRQGWRLSRPRDVSFAAINL